jgi:4-amino-4-deoxy-L-arabinose transferase-like glycosyltransferase
MKTHADSQYQRRTALYVLAFCLSWWSIFAFTRHYLDGADMVENYAWGMEWQWGTNKHPPLFGWITALWFTLLPTSDVAYYLLAEINLAVALGLLALAMRRFFTPEKILTAIVLTSLVSHFGPDSGFKYNANTAQLPFLAGFVWSQLHAIEKGGSRWFVLAGVFAAAAILTKYYSLVPLVAIGLACVITLRPALSVLIKTVTITGATAVLLVLPHIVWAIHHGWPTLDYLHVTHRTLNQMTATSAYLSTTSGALAFSSVSVVAWGASLLRLPVVLNPITSRPPRLGLGILILSVALTLLTSFVEHVNPVSSWLIPALLFLGWALMDLTPTRFDTEILARRVYRIGGFYLLAAIIGAGVWARHYRAYPAPPPYALGQTVAEDVTHLYQRTYGQGISYVAGTFPLPYALSFYSPDHPHALYALDLAHSPWIDPGALKMGNKVVVCGTLYSMPPDDPACRSASRVLFGTPDQTRQLAYQVFDPKTKGLSFHHFEVLMWKPPGRE